MRDGGGDGEKRGGEHVDVAPPERALLLMGDTFLKRKVLPTASRAAHLKNVMPLKLNMLRAIMCVYVVFGIYSSAD
jgi:hypothetical protein